MARLPDANATALRAALGSPWPELRRAATRVVKAAIAESATYAEAAENLGVSLKTLDRLRSQMA